MNRSEEVHISFSVMGEGSFHWPLKAAETRLNRHSDHKGKKWRTWCLAPWWQVAFRGEKKATTHPSFSRCTLSHTPPSPPHFVLVLFGLVWYALRCVTLRRRRLICDLDGHLILSHRVGMGNMFGGWVSSAASVTIRALSLLSLCPWLGGMWGGQLTLLINRWQSSVTVHYSQLFWVKRWWMRRKVKMAEDRWTGQVESWRTGWPSAISLPVRFSPEWRSKIETFIKAMHHFVELLASPFLPFSRLRAWLGYSEFTAHQCVQLL